MVRRILHVSIEDQQLKKLIKLLKKAQKKKGFSTLTSKVKSLLPENMRHWRLGHMVNALKTEKRFYAGFPFYDIEIAATRKKGVVHLVYRSPKQLTWTLFTVPLSSIEEMKGRTPFINFLENMRENTGVVPKSCIVELRGVDPSAAKTFLNWDWEKKK